MLDEILKTTNNDINSLDDNNFSPLTHAIEGKYNKIIYKLINFKVDINEQDISIAFEVNYVIKVFLERIAFCLSET